MAKYCSDCDCLNTKKNKGDGIYECKKNKKFVLANIPLVINLLIVIIENILINKDCMI